MNYSMTRYIMGQLAIIIAAVLVVPFIMAFAYAESNTPFAFGVVIAGLALFGGVSLCFKPKNTEIRPKCGIMFVALAWLFLSVVGALPFFISGYIPSFLDSLFETVSGFTTTGSTIMPNVEILPKSLHFWRSFTHWIGGMGVLVLAIAVLPKTDKSIVHLMKAEVPGPQFGKLVSKLRFTARILYGIYIVLTLIEVVCLMIAGMPVFDSFIHAFGTAGTGGFSNRAESIGYYDSVAVDIIITVFMLIFSVNFNLYYFILIGHVKEAVKSEELRTLLGLFMASTLIIAISLTVNNFYNFAEALRHGSFQVASVMSTTGYATADFSKWPMLCQVILFVLMFFGGSAGSTAGGLKIVRTLILFKAGRNAFKRSYSPREYMTVRMDGKVLDNSLVRDVCNYFVVYMIIYFASFILVSISNGGTTADGFITNFTAVTTCFNNVGPGLGAVSPVGSFAGFTPFAKIVFIFDMLLGRLEIMPMLLLFNPKAWKKA